MHVCVCVCVRVCVSRDCLKGSIMASPDAEVKCPFRDDDYECNVTIPEREIRQVRVDQPLNFIL